MFLCFGTESNWLKWLAVMMMTNKLQTTGLNKPIKVISRDLFLALRRSKMVSRVEAGVIKPITIASL